jgi:hypothetical protein
MSKDSQSLSSSQNVSQEATQQKKITKVGARYIQIEEFKDSDHHRGYFCYNCVYFVKPHHCAIVTDEGIDIQGHNSGVIAPHGLCSIWTPNKEEIHGATSSRGSSAAATEVATSSLSDESTPGISAQFSCDFCNKTFNSREALKQHRIKEHNNDQ